MSNFSDRLAHAWNAFMNKDPTPRYDVGNTSGYRPDRIRLTRGNERSIVTTIYNKIATDVAAISIKHVRLDEKGRYLEDINSSLNECLTISANKDQIPRAFLQDVVMSMFDEGVVAIVPVDTDINPETKSFDIESLRVGEIVDWAPDHVKIKVYNDRTLQKVERWFPKSIVGIVENPFYSIMNEPNSTAKRLVRKLSLLDYIDEQSGSNKLDLIIQLPYVVRGDLKKKQAEERRNQLIEQISSSDLGIAYIDGTEHVTQLNRSINSNLMPQIEYLTTMLYSQLGMTQSILDGTADEKTMINYNNRIIEPVISVIVDEMKRKFLTKTARTQRQSIVFFREPFKLVPVSELAEIADKFTRNEIMSTNEIRQIIGMAPVDDPLADQLRNKNLNPGEDQQFASTDENAPKTNVVKRPVEPVDSK